MNAREIKRLMARHGLRPNRRLGQNFLVDPSYLDRIVAAAELAPGEHVLEIGPGLGALTERLLATGARVTAVELDRGFIPILHERFGSDPAFDLHHGDVLEIPPEVLLPDGGPYRVVANIPYYITSAVLRHLLEGEPTPEVLVLLVQKEVAERVTAGAGEMSLLALSVQLYGEPELVATVPAGAFYPAPKVDSAILRVRPTPGRHSVDDPDRFWAIARAGFGQRRKQLKNSLDAGLPDPSGAILAALERAGIAPTRRAQSLTLEEWVALARELG